MLCCETAASVTAYEISEWSELFVATAGAAAALAGLVFVAVSINLDRILALAGIPERALQTVVMLVVVVIVSIAALIPGQEPLALGIELLVIAIVYAGGLVRTSRSPNVAQATVLAAGAVPLLIGALSVIAESGGGLYWIVAGIVGAIAGGVANAWVLLVEIQR